MAQDRAKDNDFKQLFLEMYPRLVRYAVSILGDGNEARDVVGDVFAPVPGGVGPMTRAMLMENTVSASRRRQRKED